MNGVFVHTSPISPSGHRGAFGSQKKSPGEPLTPLEVLEPIRRQLRTTYRVLGVAKPE